MLLKKKSEVVNFVVEFEMDAKLHLRLTEVEALAEEQGLMFDLKGEVIRMIAGQVSRAEKVLKKVK